MVCSTIVTATYQIYYRCIHLPSKPELAMKQKYNYSMAEMKIKFNK